MPLSLLSCVPSNARRRPPSALWAALLVASGLIAAPGIAVEPLPDPGPGPAITAPESAAPPEAMYIPDPQGADGFAGLAPFMPPEELPTWPRWFAGANGLVMTRTLPAGSATMQPVGGVQLSTGAAGASWPGGVDLHIGRWFGPRQHNAVELIYWGVYGIGSSASVTASGINAIPQADGASVGTTPANNYLVGASSQQITRSDLVNDIEINWVYSLWDRPEFLSLDPAKPGRSVNLMWLAGFRFFQLNDTLGLATSSATAGSPLDFNVATNNNLYGGQVGAKFDWHLLSRLRFSAVPKFLIAGNAITNTSTLSTGGGTFATFNGSGAPVSVYSNMGVFSWLGSVDTGLAWDVTDHWSLSLGYRVVGVGNIAQADGQWPANITTAADLSGITAGSSTIIHGGFAGFEGRY